MMDIIEIINWIGWKMLHIFSWFWMFLTAMLMLFLLFLCLESIVVWVAKKLNYKWAENYESLM